MSHCLIDSNSCFWRTRCLFLSVTRWKQRVSLKCYCVSTIQYGITPQMTQPRFVLSALLRCELPLFKNKCLEYTGFEFYAVYMHVYLLTIFYIWITDMVLKIYENGVLLLLLLLQQLLLILVVVVTIMLLILLQYFHLLKQKFQNVSNNAAFKTKQVFVGHLTYIERSLWVHIMKSFWWKHQHCRRKIAWL